MLFVEVYFTVMARARAGLFVGHHFKAVYLVPVDGRYKISPLPRPTAMCFEKLMMIIKMAIYCPQGSGTLRQQLLMMH